MAQGTNAELASAIIAHTAKDPQATVPKINRLNGIDNVTCQQNTHGTYEISIQASSDVRAQVAQQLVAYDLLALSSGEAGLEALFMQLASSKEQP